MITFLSSPKPFRGPDKDNQYRAIRNWLQSTPESEVILYGDSEGIEEAGIDLSVRVVKDIECASSGIPYFGAIADHSTINGKYDLQIYLNCDILISGILPALELIRFSKFLLIGERIDLDKEVIIDVNKRGWTIELDELAKKSKVAAHGPTGIDYFAFRRGTWQCIPSIIIGRAGYDNAIMAFCMRNKIPIIDGSLSILSLHQFHDYKHVTGEKKVVFNGAEAMQNFEAAGGRQSRTLVSDADYVLRDHQIVPGRCRGDLLRMLELKCRYNYCWNHLWPVLRAIWRLMAIFNITGIKKIELEKLISSAKGM